MRILFIFPNFFFIGAQRAAAATIRKLNRSKFNPSVIVINPSGEMKDEIPSDVPIYKLPTNNWLSKIPFFRIFSWPLQLNKFLRETPVDCVVSICPQTNFTLVLYKFLFKDSPIFIGEEHQHLTNALTNDPKDFRFPWKYLYRLSLKNYYRLDKLRCVSKAASIDFELSWGIPKDKIITIYPAFDLERIKNRTHGKQANNSVPVVCSVGRLTSQKDFTLLIQAFAIVRKSISARLVIAGTGPEYASLTSLINELGLNNDIELLGFVEYAEEVIASSDLFVMTSIWEGFPATLVEAMTIGTPVLSVDCLSGPSELIEHGVNGFLVQSRKPEKIAKYMIYLLKRKACRLEMAKNASTKIANLQLEVCVKLFEDMLTSVTSHNTQKEIS